jgi:hypothetical protein
LFSCAVIESDGIYRARNTGVNSSHNRLSSLSQDIHSIAEDFPLMFVTHPLIGEDWLNC